MCRSARPLLPQNRSRMSRGSSFRVKIAVGEWTRRPLWPWRSGRTRITLVALRPRRPLRPGLAPRDRRLARMTVVGRRVDQPQLTVQ
jgi:hypothetical protein